MQKTPVADHLPNSVFAFIGMLVCIVVTLGMGAGLGSCVYTAVRGSSACDYEPVARIKQSAMRQAVVYGYTPVGILSDSVEDQPPAVTGTLMPCHTPVLRMTLRARPDNGRQYEADVNYQQGAFRLGPVRDLGAPVLEGGYHGK